MNSVLSSLIRMSRALGGDTTLVQSGGGNTSVKTADGRFMYVKASGTALKDMAPRRGWRRAETAKVLAVLEDASLATMSPAEREARVVDGLAASCADNVKDGSRPSVETHLHALLGTAVVHLHPLSVGALVCSKKGRAVAGRLFRGEKLPPLWVPYVDPGYMLGRKIASLVKRYTSHHGKAPQVIFLEKHGLLVAADTPDKALRLARRVVRLCAGALKKGRGRAPKPLRPSPEAVSSARLAVRKAAFDATGDRLTVAHFAGGEVERFMARRNAKKLASTPALAPDEIVYAGGSPVWADRPDPAAITKKIRHILDRGEKMPAAFLVKGLGLFTASEPALAGSVREITEATLAVRPLADSLGGIKSMTARERTFIAHWEAEAFRRVLVAGDGSGELRGRIAVVTGAGSGLGRSIALGLSREGALVAFCDVDIKSARAAAKGAAGPAVAIRCDVTNESSVDDCFSAVIDEWGGLDVLVNAAGIAPAHPLVELSLDKWRAALEVNLTGYFLMARAAARIMLEQGMGGSIVNISSKSGIEASRSNTAYNATKAGEIHMARGWALELGEAGIRVNSVAPGNVFEGSKIWSPAYIRACAKKYGISSEEVIPHYVGMSALKREVKGTDVADAVVFLCSDRARTVTGQVLVTDSGQVMVR